MKRGTRTRFPATASVPWGGAGPFSAGIGVAGAALTPPTHLLFSDFR
ncbi:MAG: hypothetical protein NTW20_02500 [Rhodobacterales bacterium]|nr:hypothetical protein [Rhodobacterales bacterium]